MSVRKFGRRWMLMGAGGAAIALPTLPSLLGGAFIAKAQEPPPPKRMVAIQSDHGGVWQHNMFPDEALASTPFDHALHRCHRGELQSTLEGGERVVSAALRAPSSVLTDSLVSKMNVLRGLDVPFYFGHGRHILGNYGPLSNTNGGDNKPPEQQTADQILAYSDAFYPTVPRRRILHFASNALSVEYADRAAGEAGGFQPLAEVSAQAIFDSVYVEARSDEMRAPPIDLVYESYRRLESGAFGAGARLGREDRARLRQYMDRLSDIRASLGSPVGEFCGDVVPPEGISRARMVYRATNYETINDIIVAAFMCDSSRIAVLKASGPFVEGMDAEGGFHEVAHNAVGSDGPLVRRLENLLRSNTQRLFSDAVLDLVSKMDGVPEGDGTMLDGSLVWMSTESGSRTHDADSVPIVSFGSAGGALQTGQYLDFRDREAQTLPEGDREFSQEGRRLGACFFQWTTTYLDAFGIPRSEWQVGSRRAFSAMAEQPRWQQLRYDQPAMDESCDAPLPILR